jgi:hypothetical protein
VYNLCYDNHKNYTKELYIIYIKLLIKIFSFALPQTGETKTAFGIGRGEWQGFMYLQWNRIPKVYEKSVDAYGIKSRCFAGFASRNLRTNPPPSTLSERQRV